MIDDTAGMVLDLGRVEDRETFSFERRFPIPTLEGGSADCRAAVTAEVVKVLNRYAVKARIAGEIRAECHRCLEQFTMPVDALIDLVIQLGEQGERPEDVEEEDFVVIPATGEARYDLFPRVREELILDMPIKLLCREDCKGLCSKCGADLNNGACGCPEEPVDRRWGPLRNLLNGENKS
jgi:DUF177 domain-containing protein